MKLSKHTIEILRNFSLIYQSLVVKEPKYLITTSENLSVTAVSAIEENLPNFAIFRVQDFLNSINLFDNIEDVDFEFKEKWIQIKSGKNRIKFITTHPTLIKNSGDIKTSKDYLEFNKFSSGFTITWSNIQRIKKAASILFSNVNTNLTTILLKIKSVNGKAIINLETNEDFLQNNYELIIDNVEGDNIDIKLPVSSLLLFKGDYKVQIFEKRMAKFSHTDLDLFYFVMSSID